MASRPFVRAFLIGAGFTLLLVCLWLLIGQGRRETPVPLGKFDPSSFVRSSAELDAPYVATDYVVVDAMLALARVRPGDHVIDLGSGDGRILIAAARSHGAGGLGVDIDPARVREATENAKAAGVSHRVEFRQQDLFRTPLQEADVVTLYLTAEVNRRLRPRILSQMRPGTRVVSHDFDMGEWRPEQRQRIGSSNIYLWIVPAQVAGRWRLRLGEREILLDLRQEYQRIEGTASSGGATTRVEQGYVNGNRVRFLLHNGSRGRTFEARLVDDALVPVEQGQDWRAERIAE